MIVAASLSDPAPSTATACGPLPSGSSAGWVETFNSDAGLYGGSGVGNHGATIPSAGGEIVLRLPANGLVVLQRA